MSGNSHERERHFFVTAGDEHCIFIVKKQVEAILIKSCNTIHNNMRHFSACHSAVLLLTVLLLVFLSVLFSRTVYARPMSYILSESKAYSFESSWRKSEACCYRDSDNIPELAELISRFEPGVNIESPEDSEIPVHIVAQGSTTLAFTIEGWEHLLIRRLPGFKNFEAAERHITHIDTYRFLLHERLIETTETHLIALDTPGGYGVAYVIQPYLRGDRLAINLMEKYGTRFKQALLKKQIEIIKKLISSTGGREVLNLSVDIVSNNFEVYDFDQSTNEFNIRLNDIAQPLFKVDGRIAYDFSDQAFSVFSPFSWMIVEPQMQAEFEDYYCPRHLLLSSLWGYEELVGTAHYSQWALEQVNALAAELELPLISSQEALKAFEQDREALSCFHLYRNLTRRVRGRFGLSSNIYMSPGNSTVEMYGTDVKPGYWECLWN